jgi:integrase
MKGGIYSREKCEICGGTFKNDGKKSLYCPVHPNQKATSFVIYFQGVYRRFKDYDNAHQVLEGLRFKYREGTFDKRDYQKDNPLSFENLSEQWLNFKQKTIKHKSFKNLSNYINRASKSFGNKNIKELGYGEIEDFLWGQDVSDKTRANMKSALHDFWMWLRKRKVIRAHEVPEFPEVSFELGCRKVIDKETQEKILDEVYRITYNMNPKIWLGIKWLCTYISIRPGEMASLKEENIDLGNGYLMFPQPKEKKMKIVPILEEDIEILRSFPEAIPSIHFFRHVKGIQGVREGEPFGEKYFYKWWVKACKNLGIEGVDLYGGTRHSSARALRQYCSPEEIKRATMHSTNKAFERYFQIESDDLREIYSKTKGSKKSKKNRGYPEKGEVLMFKD